jgi:hypothetical protein
MGIVGPIKPTIELNPGLPRPAPFTAFALVGGVPMINMQITGRLPIMKIFESASQEDLILVIQTLEKLLESKGGRRR